MLSSRACYLTELSCCSPTTRWPVLPTWPSSTLTLSTRRSLHPRRYISSEFPSEKCLQTDTNILSTLSIVSRLYQLIPCDNIDKPMYLSTGLKWSSKDTNSPVGHPRLHQVPDIVSSWNRVTVTTVAPRLRSVAVEEVRGVSETFPPERRR